MPLMRRKGRSGPGITTVSADGDGGDVSARAFSRARGGGEPASFASPELAANTAGKHKDAAASAASERSRKFIVNIPSDLLVV
jgi:hypothetical protein